ncbi:PilZ domain-containing protein [Sphingosinicella terrae]|uniref:PilZ domain-containing protein n=1 Tax=Sphingosinicella terrae TaxID=2172047 RepID=UPI0013B43B7F|nr:PilZ domain-containing protein [Sphingosinicella terrae]
MGGDDKAELRRSRRLKVFQPAALAGPAGTIRIHLLDVSATGALAYAATAPPAVGDALQLECAGIVAAATVRWCKGNRFGLHFDAPLDAEALRRIASPSHAAKGRA